MKCTFLATAAFGLEGVAANELRRMGYAAKAEQGGARFEGEPEDALRANLWLRTADRVLLVLAEAPARSFDELFDLAASVRWADYLPRDAAIPVSAKCARSQLMSERDCQAIVKKAIVSGLQRAYTLGRLPESGAAYGVEVSLHADRARIALDMSGAALNRRGYRTWNGEAPLRETLAAALVELSPWRPGMPLYDPCCGTGTLMIEAALKQTGRAPGLTRPFACEQYAFVDQAKAQSLRQEARTQYDPLLLLDAAQAAAALAGESPPDPIADSEGRMRKPAFIGGSDIDPEAMTLCSRHIRQAGLDGRIHARVEDLRAVRLALPGGVFLCNPPYGERMSDQKHCRALYGELGALLKRHPGWGMGLITADPALERSLGRRADKKRRLYNGRLECEFYVFEPRG